MFNRKQDYMVVKYVLKTGETLYSRVPKNTEWSASDLTDKVIHRVSIYGLFGFKSCVFVQGSNIAYLEINQSWFRK